jgi:HlyD family secretion protein
MNSVLRAMLAGLVIVVLLLLSACGGFGQPEATPTPDFLSDFEAPGVIADGRVLPIRSVDLDFQLSGTVAEILVAVGDEVAAGQPLARLDSIDLELRVEEAEVALARAQAAYSRLESGASEEEISAAEAGVEQAAAALRQAEGSVTGADIAAARDRLSEARARLARLEAGPKDNQVQMAQAIVDEAIANLQAQRDALSSAKSDAELQLEQAANKLRDAQDEYSRIYWDNRELEEALDNDIPQAEKDREAAALRAVQSAETALEQAQLALEQARQSEINGINAAEARVRDARARLADVLAGVDDDEIAAARAQVSQARAALVRLSGAEQAGRIDAAAARVAEAEAQLEELRRGPRSGDLEVASSDIRAAEVALKQAERRLSKATLLAPFSGTVAAVNLEVGEAPAELEPAIVLADFSDWKIETSDLTELSVVDVSVGDEVTITFDALPDLTLRGTVTEIKPIGESFQGDVNYTVVIKPAEWHEQLRWNMTATIQVD